MIEQKCTPAGDPFVAAASLEAGEARQAQAELLAAASFAVEWFREREMHAPPDTAFGGEEEVEARLRRAIRKGRSEEEV